MRFFLSSLVLLLSISLITSKSIITFKSKSCEEYSFLELDKTSSTKNNFYGMKYLKQVGMIIIDMDSYDLFNYLSESSTLKACIKGIYKSHIRKLDLPKLDLPKDDEDFKQWHLKRINVRNLPLPESFTRNDVGACKSHVYVIDSGIDKNHPEFVGLIADENQHQSFVEKDPCCKNDFDALCDCSSHGTHCAGIVASPTSGYNTKTTLHSMKVFDESGSASDDIIIEAINNAIELRNKYHKEDVTIFSLSIGGENYPPLDQASNRAVEQGIFVAIAAGNENGDACKSSPASAKLAVTVGASDINDNRAVFSNFGDCVDIFAPGVKIYSSIPGGKYAYYSGTSMATPFIAGYASYVGCHLNTTNPKRIENYINLASTKNIVKDSLSKENNLPYDGEI